MKMAVDFDKNHSFKPQMNRPCRRDGGRNRDSLNSSSLRHLRVILHSSLTRLRRSGAVVTAETAV